MKRIDLIFSLIITLFMINLAAGQDFYASRWRTVSDNEKLGKVAANLPIFNEIRTRALANQQISQLLRAEQNIYEVNQLINDDPENDYANQHFRSLLQTKEKMNGANMAIFNLYLADYLYQYYLQHSWKLRNKIAVTGERPANLSDWDKDDFMEEIAHHFSNINAAQLDNQKFADYREVFETENKPLITLQDFFYEKQINFYQDSSIFTANEIKANKAKTAEIYALAIKNSAQSAQWYFRHQQVNFLIDCQKCEEKIHALNELLAKKEDAYQQVIAQELASIYSENHRKPQALQLLKLWRDYFPKSQYAEQLTIEINDLEKPHIQAISESVSSAKMPIHLVLDGKNVGSVTLEIRKIENLTNSFSDNNDEDSVSKGKLITQKEILLPETQDLEMHRTSLDLGTLPPGSYVILISQGKDVKTSLKKLVSEARAVRENSEGKPKSLLIYRWTDRETGKSILGKSISILSSKRSKNSALPTIKMLDNGLFQLQLPKETYYGDLLLSDGQNMDLLKNIYRENDEPATERAGTIQIFTDRKIYRPGQTVYWKAIFTGKNSVEEGKTITLKLEDSNGNEVGKTNGKTNDFGSFSGSFLLPNAALPGRFALSANADNASSSEGLMVEEYKRPKVEITFKPLPEELQFGKTILVQGQVKNYSGTMVANAAVKFSVRGTNYFWHPWRGFFPMDSGEIIQSGTVTTAADGSFSLPVQVTANDENVQKLSYEITVDALDETGESQSAVMKFVAGKSPFVIETDSEDQILEDRPTLTITARAVNADGKNLSRSAQLLLEKLRGPEKIYRKNFQTVIQDNPKMAESEFNKTFPHDYFDSLAVKRESEVIERKILGVYQFDATRKNIEIPSPGAGRFRLTFLQPNSQDSLPGKINFQVFSKTSSVQNPKSFLSLAKITDSLEAGKNLDFTVFSSVEGASAEAFLQYGGKVYKMARPIQQGFADFKFSIPANLEVENVNLQVRLISFNDAQTEERTIKYLQPKKDLQLHWTTFRDKILPGSRQIWQIGVKKGDGTAANAEILAMMYDASLDVLAPNPIRWEKGQTQYFGWRDFSVNENLAWSTQLFLHRTDRRFLGNKKIITRTTTTGFINQEAVSERSAPPAPMAMMAKADAGGKAEEPDQKLRSNFAETAFFYPNLLTGTAGAAQIEFTAPDVLTRWKVQILAHNTQADGGTLTAETVTNKPFAVTPNYPRFLRTGDRITFLSKINREGAGAVDGMADLQIRDAFSGEEVTNLFVTNGQKQNFRLDAQNTATVRWELQVPAGHPLVELTTRATSGNQTDGERMALSVLPKKPTVKQGFAIVLKPGEKRTVNLKEILPNSENTSDAVLKMHTNTVTDYLLQLPPLLQNEDKTAEALMSKILAAQTGLKMFAENPTIIPVIREKLSRQETSRLSQNEALNNLSLAETPWMPAAQQDKAKAAALQKYLDKNYTENTQKEAITALLKLQNTDGGFSWYPGALSDFSVSVRMLKFIQEMQALNSKPLDEKSVQELISFLDEAVAKDLKEEKKSANYQTENFTGYLAVRPVFQQEKKYPNFYNDLVNRLTQKINQTKPSELTFYELPTTMMALHRNGQTQAAVKIVNYLQEIAVNTEHQGVYWKKNNPGWGWTQSAVATELAVLKAMNEMENAPAELQENIDLWLAAQYETGNFRNAADAADYLAYLVQNKKIVSSAKADLVVNGQNAKPEQALDGFNVPLNKMPGTITLENKGNAPLFGGIFWQGEEFAAKSEDVKISASTAYFLKNIVDNREVLVPVSEQTKLKVGDRVVAKTAVNADRNMQFVTLQIHRAATLEPVSQLSGTQWKEGLSYYLANTDRTSNVFIHHLPKGRFEISQEFFVNAAGTANGGTTILQNYHAPQVFTGSGEMLLKTLP